MNKRDVYIVLENRKIAKDIYQMKLEGDTRFIKFPGQFINIEIEGLYLRRPISVCDVDVDYDTITIVYKVVGDGTEKMSQMIKGKKLDILTGLGNGFNINKCEGDKPLLIGGGVGTPPMYMLCKELIKYEKRPIVVLGFNSEKDVFYEKEFKKLGVKTYVSTVDGSYGEKGLVTDVIKELDNYTYYYACGPVPMLKAAYDSVDCNGEFSFEARMGCGFGACMGCTVQTKNGLKRVCKEGPVFKKEEIIW